MVWTDSLFCSCKEYDGILSFRLATHQVRTNMHREHLSSTELRADVSVTSVVFVCDVS